MSFAFSVLRPAGASAPRRWMGSLMLAMAMPFVAGQATAQKLAAAASRPANGTGPTSPSPKATPVADARIEALTPEQAEQERLRALTESAPKAYEDNYLSPEAAARVASDAAGTGSDEEGYRA